MMMQNDDIKSIRNTVYNINRRLAKLEKLDLTEESVAYKSLVKLAKGYDSKDGVNYLTLSEDGSVRFRTDIIKMSKENTNMFEAFLSRLEKVEQSTTSSAKGIMKAHKEAFKGYQQSIKSQTGKNPNMTFGQYLKWFKEEKYKELVNDFGASQLQKMIDEALNSRLDMKLESDRGKSRETLTEEIITMLTKTPIKSYMDWKKAYEDKWQELENAEESKKKYSKPNQAKGVPRA